ncbi:cupin domain-containing protein [Streptomyces sp. SID3343]|uniref:cupin domain-containing protein n=1 Tax=Streptomyces sp. SID3343 TaxID=2690260 RepID=UPI001368D9EB|nr:cupin domain-containing protein [Streptomyces sp. SID3343]MYW02860.1 cupin domain-containing protein [Streptomyces sp. SID3343]
MPVIRNTDARRTSTPNAAMITYASPTQGGATAALWHVAMDPGAKGPYHAFDAEQIWTVLSGAFVVELDGERLTVGTGDTLVAPADAPRRVYADADAGFTAIVTAPAGALAYNPNDVTPPDACGLAPRDAARIAPPWMV